MSNALHCYQPLSFPQVPLPDAVAYSWRPKAEPKTANNMVVLLRRTALQAMVSLVRSKVCARSDLLVDGADHLRGTISGHSKSLSDQFTYARHFGGVERAGLTAERDVVVLHWRCQRLRFVDKIQALASRGFALR